MNETTDTKTETAATVEAAPKRTRKAPAKTATAKTAPVEAAAPVPVEAPAKAAPAGGPKLRWTVTATHVGGKDQHADAEGRTYRIEKVGDEYVASLAVDGHKNPEVLATGSFARCYGAAVAHNKGHGVAATAA